MPVLITGATGTVGRALAGRLVAEGAQVRAYVRHDDAALRALGVHLAIGSLDDVERLEAALTRVHTLVHLAGGLWPERGASYDLLVRDPAESAAIAARAADVRRIVCLSWPGADPASGNEMLAAFGRAEEHVRGSGLEHAIFRCAPIVAEGSQMQRVLTRLRRGPLLTLPGGGAQRWAAVALEDVVDALLAADAREASVAGTWDLAGPDPLAPGEVAAALGVGGRAVFPGVVPGAPRALVEVLAQDVLPDAAPARAQLGLSLGRATR